MTLATNGAISFGGSTVGRSVALELGLTATTRLSMNDNIVRVLANVASGSISFSNFYGKSANGAGANTGNTGNTTNATSTITFSGTYDREGSSTSFTINTSRYGYNSGVNFIADGTWIADSDAAPNYEIKATLLEGSLASTSQCTINTWYTLGNTLNWKTNVFSTVGLRFDIRQLNTSTILGSANYFLGNISSGNN